MYCVLLYVLDIKCGFLVCLLRFEVFYVRMYDIELEGYLKIEIKMIFLFLVGLS